MVRQEGFIGRGLFDRWLTGGDGNCHRLSHGDAGGRGLHHRTAQLAFTNGFSALWFTLGAGLGCLVLALFFARPMRRSGYKTLQQMVAAEYGAAAGFLSSVLGILGTMLSIVAQVLSAMALMGTLLPLSPFACALLSVVLMMGYVLFGGVWGAGLVGTVKSVLLCLAALLGGLLALTQAGGWQAMGEALPGFFNLFGRGVGIDAGAGLSLVLGVLSTQTYAQSVLAGRSDRVAVSGALWSALLIPPIGLGSALVGMVMRMRHPDMTPAQAFPRFVLEFMPDWLAAWCWRRCSLRCWWRAPVWRWVLAPLPRRTSTPAWRAE